jgi:hypothetical protein
LYSKVGKFTDAVSALQRHFDLLKILDARTGGGESSRDLISVRDIDIARAYVGISKGNLFLNSYAHAIKFQFLSLLNWKLTRSEFPESRTNCK